MATPPQRRLDFDLGLTRETSRAEITRAYCALLREHHLDTRPRQRNGPTSPAHHSSSAAQGYSGRRCDAPAVLGARQRSLMISPGSMTEPDGDAQGGQSRLRLVAAPLPAPLNLRPCVQLSPLEGVRRQRAEMTMPHVSGMR